MSIVSLDSWEPISGTEREALRAAYPHPARILVAMRLARDVETCAALLRGEPVLEASLDQGGLTWARGAAVVRLDEHAADLFDLREVA